MTIAITLKVNDGVVLAADSASTLLQRTDNGNAVVNVYNNANKIFNLRKGLPIGALTWGSGAIGASSISTLVKTFRRLLTEPSTGDAANEWHLDGANYTVLDVATRLRKFIFEDHYVPAFADWPQKPYLGFVVAGYSTGSYMAEEYLIAISGGECGMPTPLRPLPECGVTWNGEPEAITRLMFGVSNATPQILLTGGLEPERMEQVFELLKSSQVAPLVQPAMPIQDASDLAEFLVETTIKFSRFMPGAATVGGPIEIATITQHEQFKWLKRKHYYHADLNPEGSR